MTITTAHKQVPIFCLLFIIITSNCDSFVSANINATISVSIEPNEENLHLTKAIIQSGEFFFNVSSQASFFIIQTHSLTSHLHLSNDQSFENQSTAVGSSIGLIQIVNKTVGVYKFYLTGVNTTNALISIQGYDGNAPIPGGCNLVLHPKIAPYQVLRLTEQMIEVFVQPAGGPRGECGDNHVKLEMYYYYFKSSYDEEAEYYENLEKMMTVDGILKYGTKVGEYTPNSSLRHYYNNYKSLGLALGVIARYGNSTAAYVPTATFGCNLLLGGDDCSIANIQFLSVLWILMGIVVMFNKDSNTLYMNHYIIFIIIVYFMSQFRIDGIYVTLLCPILLLLWISYSLVSGLELDQCLNAPILGYLLSDWIFFGFFADNVLFKNGLLYWTIIRAVVVVFLTCLVYRFKKLTSMATGFIYQSIGWSMCFGGVLYYIFIDDVRHMIFPNFHTATIDPPVLLGDVIGQLIAMFCIALYTGLEYWGNRRNTSTIVNERSRLLDDSI